MLLFLTGSCLTLAPAFAQTASQITPDSFAPEKSRETGASMVIGEGAVKVPDGADQLSVTLSAVTVDGGGIDDGQQQMLNTALLGRPVSVAEIFAAASALEKDFASRDEALTRVLVPAQELEDGSVLHLQMVRGQIDSISVSALPESVRDAVLYRLSPLVGRADVTLTEIERRLLIAGDIAGLTLRSTLAPGQRQGGVTLVLSGDFQPVSGFLSFDNLVSDNLGGSSLGLGLDLNNSLGFAETLYFRASGYPDGYFRDDPRNRALAAGVLLPIGRDGLSANVEFVDARTTPLPEPGFPQLGSHYERLSARLSYPVIRQRAVNLFTTLSFDAENERQDVVDPALPISLDKYRVLRLGTDFSHWLPGNGDIGLSVNLSQGIDALGARSAADATVTRPLSRAGADADFTKLELGGSLRQPIAKYVELALTASAQTSFGDPLGNAEQIGLATANGLSPLPNGSLQGDTGYVGRGEILFPIYMQQPSGVGVIRPYLFGAYGSAKLEQPTLLERKTTDAHAYGVGARFIGNPARVANYMRVTAEYGRAELQGMTGHADRFSFTTLLQF